MSAPSNPLALEVRGVSKRFGGVVALDDVAFGVEPGEVHALIGVNGSGKSTLIKILTGYHAPEPGAQMQLWGEPVLFPVRNHVRLGMAVLHQQLGLVDTLTVRESVGVGVRYGARHTFVSWGREREHCRRLSQTVDMDIDPSALVGELSAPERTAVALFRSIRELEATDRRHLFLLDEPTVSFTPTETQKLIAVITRVKSGGGSVIFVSHKLPEVLSIADRISVLRDGRLVATVPAREANTDSLVNLMLGGAELSASIGSADSAGTAERNSEPLLRLDGVTGRTVAGVTLDIAPGEIVGFTGLAGMGQDELPYLLSGARELDDGLVLLDDKPLAHGIRGNLRRGVALVPGDRARQGLWMDGSARENLTLPVLGRFFLTGLLRTRRELRHVNTTMRQFHVSPPEAGLAASGFSGGNQQKIVLAKAMQSGPRVLLLHEPTIGVDVGAKAEIYNLIRRSTGSGTAALVFGSDYDEMAELCTRVIVLNHGRVVAELTGEKVTEQRIAAACNAVLEPAADLRSDLSTREGTPQ